MLEEIGSVMDAEAVAEAIKAIKQLFDDLAAMVYEVAEFVKEAVERCKPIDQDWPLAESNRIKSSPGCYTPQNMRWHIAATGE